MDAARATPLSLETVTVKRSLMRWQRHASTSHALNGGLGNVIVVVEPTTPSRKNRWENGPVIVWAQATFESALMHLLDGSTLIGWATSLKDGKRSPKCRCQSGVSQAGRQGVTRQRGGTQTDGLAHLALVGSLPCGSTQLLVARTGNDVARLPQNSYQGMRGGGWIKSEPLIHFAGSFSTIAGCTAPAEEVHLKGWIRRIGRGKEKATSAPLGEAASGVAYAW